MTCLHHINSERKQHFYDKQPTSILAHTGNQWLCKTDCWLTTSAKPYLVVGMIGNFWRWEIFCLDRWKLFRDGNILLILEGMGKIMKWGGMRKILWGWSQILGMEGNWENFTEIGKILLLDGGRIRKNLHVGGMGSNFLTVSFLTVTISGI